MAVRGKEWEEGGASRTRTRMVGATLRSSHSLPDPSTGLPQLRPQFRSSSHSPVRARMFSMPDTDIHLQTTCPHCGAEHDSQRRIAGPPRTPRNNDATVCSGCGRLSLYVFDELGTVSLRIPTKAELAQMRQELDADIAQVIIMGFAIASTEGVDE